MHLTKKVVFFTSVVFSLSLSVTTSIASDLVVLVNGMSTGQEKAQKNKDALEDLLITKGVCSANCITKLSHVKTQKVFDLIEVEYVGVVEKISLKQAFGAYIDKVIDEYNRVKQKVIEAESYLDTDTLVISRLKWMKNNVLDNEDLSVNFIYPRVRSGITKRLINSNIYYYSNNYDEDFGIHNSVLLMIMNNNQLKFDSFFYSAYREYLTEVSTSMKELYEGEDPNIADQVNTAVDKLFNTLKSNLKADKNIVVVAHSQGNHIIELAHSKLEQDPEISPKELEKLQVVGLGSIALSTPNDTYLTSSKDFTVFNLFDGLSVGSPLPANFIDVDLSLKDISGHSFIDVYLSGIKGKYKHQNRGNISKLPKNVQTVDYEIRDVVSLLVDGSFKRLMPIASIEVDNELGIIEGNSGENILIFNVSLDQQDIDEDISVDVETFDQTAIAGIDYRKTKKTVTFKKDPGLRTIKFEVPIIGDTDLEDDETFGVLLTNASGAKIDESKKQAIGTILNDDEDLPVVSIINKYTITEPDSGSFDIAVPVSLNEASLEQVTVDVQISNGTAVAGSDYIAQNTSLTFPPGTTSHDLKVSIVGDTINESEESFTVTISNVVGATIGNAEAEIVIKDNDLEEPIDIVPPVITLDGDNPMTVTQGAVFTDPGATAFDDQDGVVTVGSTGTVDTSIIGTYTITYTAFDNAGNSSTTTRTINVIEVVATPTVSSVLPDTANVFATVAQNFIVTGENLTDGITISLGSCPSPALQAGGNDRQRIFRCTPLSDGIKAGLVIDGDVQKPFTVTVESKPDSVAIGSITSPTEGETLQGSTIQVILNAQDIDGLAKVSLTLKENQPSFVVCEDGTVTECNGTQITRTVAFNPSDYGATEGAVDIGLWVKDESGQTTRVDSVGINWNESIAYDGIPLLLVKVEYTDVMGFVGSDSEWSNRVFSTGSGTTVNDYFLENSKGRFKYAPARESNGVVNDGVVKVVLDIPHPRGNTIANYRNGAYLETINKAILNLSDEINFSQFNTKDVGSGKVTGDELSILFVIAGYDARHNGDPATWPHAVYCCDQVVSGISINSNVAVVGEKREATSAGVIPITIGSVVHELGHTTFGLPDLYARFYNNSKDSDPAGGIGIYGLMGAGDDGGDILSGKSPSHLSAWSKIEAGLVQPTVVSSDGEYTLYDTASSNYNVLKIQTSRANEYFLVENRALNGFDSGIQDESFKQGSECYVGSGCEYKGGILIWRIDEACPNNDYANECLKVEPLAQDYGERGRYSPAWGNGEDFFHSGMLTEANATSVPSTKFFDGQSTGISISVNDPPGQSMRVNVDVP